VLLRCSACQQQPRRRRRRSRSENIPFTVSADWRATNGRNVCGHSDWSRLVSGATLATRPPSSSSSSSLSAGRGAHRVRPDDVASRSTASHQCPVPGRESVLVHRLPRRFPHVSGQQRQSPASVPLLSEEGAPLRNCFNIILCSYQASSRSLENSSVLFIMFNTTRYKVRSTIQRRWFVCLSSHCITLLSLWTLYFHVRISS